MLTRSIAMQGWAYYREFVRQKWNFFSDRDLDEIAGDPEKLVAKIEERYGLCRKRSERCVQDFFAALV